MLLTLSIPINKINEKNINYKECTKNKILTNSTFCKLLYSNDFTTINGIPIYLEFITQSYNSKYKLFINKYANSALIKDITAIENKILQNYHCYKNPIYKIKDTIQKGVLKINTEYPISNKFIIKITGIWETDIEYGLTYRMINF
mgnify:CR=1 FL=1